MFITRDCSLKNIKDIRIITIVQFPRNYRLLRHNWIELDKGIRDVNYIYKISSVMKCQI